MDRHPKAGLDSYDRLFPNQDTLPRGGFGNLIALPLQKQARERGNSVFVDEQLEPYSDQRAFLSGIQKIDRLQGASRARSATEAFLYRRLETLPETSGRFQVNVQVPIAFDNFGSMEVDLLCADSQLVVEVDGPQHLDPAAYRRDRRKDQLLQENGYLILRFLAEDVPESWMRCSMGFCGH
jgi:very-short-patch-repair endonuclease